MGNSTSTGHVLVGAGLGTEDAEKSLHRILRMHKIHPWSAKELLRLKLQNQVMLAQESPLRCIPVREGLHHYQKFLGDWLGSMAREDFVRASIELLKMKGVPCNLGEQNVLYDVFDSVDLYENDTLSIGALCGGLSSFLAGSIDEHAVSMFDILCNQLGSQGRFTKEVLRSLLQPYVWCMVPSGAEVLRPVLLEQVTKKLFFDIACNTEVVTAQQFQTWIRAICRPAAHANKKFYVTPRVNLLNAIVDQIATNMDSLTRTACDPQSGAAEFKACGNSTHVASHVTRPHKGNPTHQREKENNSNRPHHHSKAATDWASQKLKGRPCPRLALPLK